MSATNKLRRPTLLNSFRYAFVGVAQLLRRERNARIHAVAAVVAIVAGLYLRLSPIEWTAIVLCIAGVLAAEAMNSAVELLADVLHPADHPDIGHAKDIAAAAVLLMSIAAAVVASLLVVPRIAAEL
ncbi:MAG: diacylglycerol kinase family protein [Planctomycetaceae bacterium]